MSLSPVDMFRTQTDLYSLFDEEGMPTHDTAGTFLLVHTHLSVREHKINLRKCTGNKLDEIMPVS